MFKKPKIASINMEITRKKPSIIGWNCLCTHALFVSHSKGKNVFLLCYKKWKDKNVFIQ